MPLDFSFIRTIEPRTLDLLNDNDCVKTFSSHINYDETLCVSIYQTWSQIPSLIERSHLSHLPELSDLAVISDLRRTGQVDVQKHNILLAKAGIISLDTLRQLEQ